MKELLFDVNFWVLTLVLLLLVGGTMELGYRLGLRSKDRDSQIKKDHINAIQASILSLMALMLGFTLSLSLERFRSLSEAVVDEANAIGTAALRVGLLPEALREPCAKLVKSYVDMRVEDGALPLVRESERADLSAKVVVLQNQLWEKAMQSARLDSSPVTSGLFVQSLNDMFDAFGRREADLKRHIPESVLWLLYVTFLLAGGIVGYVAGLAGHRPALASYLMAGMIAALVLIILDLDRPRRGLITVSQESLVTLQTSLQK